MKKIVLGTGSRLRRDDAAGSLLAEEFYHEDWLSIDGGTVPENYFSIVKKNSPEVLIIVDACEMGLPPGSMRRIKIESIAPWSGFNTHSLSLSHFLKLLSENSEEIIFIGIQPLNTDIGEGLTPPVRESVNHLKKLLSDDNINSIETLEKVNDLK